MSGKKICINCSTSYYTGKEQSPLHFGLSAEGYDINSIMEGFDKELWIVDVKNNKKVWTKKEHINKMTYEKPLITETTQNNCDGNDGNTQTIAHNDNDNDNANAASNAAANTNTNAASNANANDADTTHQVPLSNTASTEESAMNKGGKPSKTIKPTDYTLFITYRISQMKLLSNDNKKNYDCARDEWKEYKKKPDELKAIMIEANNFSKSK